MYTQETSSLVQDLYIYSLNLYINVYISLQTDLITMKWYKSMYICTHVGTYGFIFTNIYGIHCISPFTQANRKKNVVS